MRRPGLRKGADAGEQRIGRRAVEVAVGREEPKAGVAGEGFEGVHDVSVFS